jgi:nitrogen regulatory protein PII-like uncharacterized protein
MKGTKYERETGCVEFVCGDCIGRVFDVFGEAGIKGGFMYTGKTFVPAAASEGKRHTNSQQ